METLLNTVLLGDATHTSAEPREGANTKVRLGEPLSLNGATDRNMGEGLLTEAEMTQSQLHH